MDDNRTRRDVLKVAGTAGVVGLAGCLGSAGTADTPTDAPRDDGHDDDEEGHDEETETHHDDEHSHGSIEGPKASAEVRMVTTDAGTHFDPHVVWVEEGGTVTWVNESGSHSATAYAPANDKPRRIPEGAESFDSGLFTAAGKEFSHTFEQAGVYDYYCIPHEGMGMIGSVIVGEPDPHDQHGLAEAQEGIPESAHEKIHNLNDQVNEALGHTHDESTATESSHDEGDSHDETDGHREDDGHHDGTPTDHHHD